jgi:hypothetical protein
MSKPAPAPAPTPTPESATNQKQKLGQFYTTNYAYILSNMSIPPDITHVIEPFVGTGDLLKFIDPAKADYTIETYDIDPKYEGAARGTRLPTRQTTRGSSLTNPPYLARNKSENKEIYDKLGCNDLYKCFLATLIGSVFRRDRDRPAELRVLHTEGGRRVEGGSWRSSRYAR